MGKYHARLSPSSAYQWTVCTAAPGAQDGIPNENSAASRAGTCCHQIAEECLQDHGLDLQDYLGREMWWDSHGHEFWRSQWPHTDESSSACVVVTQEMLDAVNSGVNFVRNIHTMRGGLLEVEQRVPIGDITGEEDAGGTSDVTIIGDDWVWVGDFKFGRAKVSAYEIETPEHRDILSNEIVPETVTMNLQMAMYALGSIKKFEMLADFQHVTVCIIQPFINHVSEYTCTVAELRKTEAFLRTKAIETRENPVFAPSQDACHFCRASGNCKAQDAYLLQETMNAFDDVTKATPKHVSDIQLGDKYALLPMLADWSKAVAERVNGALREGLPVLRSDGISYKHVAGKKGDRSWMSEDEVRDYLKKIRLKDEHIFTMKLKSPTQIEPLSKPPKTKKGETPGSPMLGKTQWNRLASMITQSDGQPVIAISTDPRPALAKATDGFDDVGSEQNSDLF